MADERLPGEELPGEELLDPRPLRRMYRFMLLLAAGGTAGAFVGIGPAAAAGFLLGAVASILNFRWLKQLVEAIGPDGRRPAGSTLFFLVGRYLLLGAAAYVIVKYFGIGLIPALTGLLVAVAAAMLEIIYELIYART